MKKRIESFEELIESATANLGTTNTENTTPLSNTMIIESEDIIVDIDIKKLERRMKKLSKKNPHGYLGREIECVDVQQSKDSCIEF